jgi:hypothetical protein
MTVNPIPTIAQECAKPTAIFFKADCKVRSRYFVFCVYGRRGADKSLARPGRKQATATEDFDFHVSYL